MEEYKPLSEQHIQKCVEVVGSMGKGSRVKYHSRGSQERLSTQLTQTLSAPGYEAQVVQFGWDAH